MCRNNSIWLIILHFKSKWGSINRSFVLLIYNPCMYLYILSIHIQERYWDIDFNRLHLYPMPWQSAWKIYIIENKFYVWSTLLWHVAISRNDFYLASSSSTSSLPVKMYVLSYLQEIKCDVASGFLQITRSSCSLRVKLVITDEYSCVLPVQQSSRSYNRLKNSWLMGRNQWHTERVSVFHHCSGVLYLIYMIMSYDKLYAPSQSTINFL